MKPIPNETSGEKPRTSQNKFWPHFCQFGDGRVINQITFYTERELTFRTLLNAFWHGNLPIVTPEFASKLEDPAVLFSVSYNGLSRHRTSQNQSHHWVPFEKIKVSPNIFERDG